ncbi:MAG: ATP-binding protein [Peptococcaceae bacterium]|nr:ATP-binding protein [Peptococcaceae bacterium]
MKKRVFLTVFGTALITVLVSVMLLVGVTYQYIHEETKHQMSAQLDYLAEMVESQGEDYLRDLDDSRYRITWIAADGTVLFDNWSDISKMENHSKRQEFIEAQKNGMAEVERHSETMTERLIYAAKLLDDRSVLRLSTDDISPEGVLWLLARPTMLLLLGVLVLTWFVAKRLSRRIVEPLNTIDLDNPLANETYDELMPLLSRIEQQHREISDQSILLNQQRNEFQIVIDNMEEGLVLLNKEGRILLMNRSATHLLAVQDEDYIGRDFLLFGDEPKLHKLLSKVYNGKNYSVSVEMDNKNYEIHGNPVFSDDDIQGVVLFYMDVTEKMEAEQLRREFSANVSHELKTPLHSISGCAELLLNNMVKEADQPQFLQQIYDEAQHMVALVENIISISKLDETSEELPLEEIDLLAMSQDVVKQLMPHAKMKDIELDVSGENVIIKGVHTLIHEMVYNLCDNAIKYNKENGSVSVIVTKNKDEAVLKVKDTGIGIPEDQVDRVFERFYRVDKSHSRASGGTGLGLSIVKHAAIRHNATIKVKSKVGKGTTISVRFPLKKKAIKKK